MRDKFEIWPEYAHIPNLIKSGHAFGLYTTDDKKHFFLGSKDLKMYISKTTKMMTTMIYFKKKKS